MKKLFTLIALAMSFMGGYAQTTLIDFEGEKTDGLTVCGTTSMSSSDKVKINANKTTVLGIKFANSCSVTEGVPDNALKIELTGGIKSGDQFEIGGAYNNSKERTAQVALFYIDDEGNRVDLFTSKEFINGRNVADDITTEKYTAVNGYQVLYLARTGNATTYVTTFKIVRPASTNESLTTAVSSFSTYAASYPVNYKSLGLTAYAIGLDETAKKVTYTEIDGIVPANTPVLVKGEASKTYSLAKAEGDATTVNTSLLTSDGTIEGDGSTIYAFGTKDGVSGFKIVKAGVKIPAKKGYLQLSSSSTGAKDFFAFGGETTGINNISANGIDEEETPLFNLAGQRVNKSYKGVVVKNGKKFVNK